MNRLKVVVILVSCLVSASCLSAERWQKLTESVLFDPSTMSTEKNKDGDRITTTWIRFSNAQSQDVLIETHAICKDRILINWSYVVVSKDGTRDKRGGSGAMDTSPGGPWEQTLTAICAKAKPWWQVL